MRVWFSFWKTPVSNESSTALFFAEADGTANAMPRREDDKVRHGNGTAADDASAP